MFVLTVAEVEVAVTLELILVLVLVLVPLVVIVGLLFRSVPILFNGPVDKVIITLFVEIRWD